MGKLVSGGMAVQLVMAHVVRDLAVERGRFAVGLDGQMGSGWFGKVF